MKNLIFVLSFFATLAFFIGCAEDKYGPLENDGVPPGTISNAEVMSLPGKVKITYTVPNDKDLLYILATFTSNGRTFEAKASYYTNSIILQGFGDTLSHEVKLYAVDRGENRSEPFSITVQSLKPPVIESFEGISINPTFGGVFIKTGNKNRSELAVVLLRKDSLGFYVLADTYYSKQDSIKFSSRGYDSVLTSFAVYMRDRWNNLSDTLYADIKPLYEAKLDKTQFREVKLPGDAQVGFGLPMVQLWDDKIGADNMWHSDGALFMPNRITFSLGDTPKKLSRFTLYQRQSGAWVYTHNNPKIYALYGSNNPDPDGSWNNWILLDSCISVKPSNSPQGFNPSEDIAAALLGETWDVPADAPAVKYVRLKVYETWAGGTAVHVSEMTFYGSDK